MPKSEAYSKIGDQVISGQVLADGSACEGGEIALGQNVLIAYALGGLQLRRCNSCKREDGD